MSVRPSRGRRRRGPGDSRSGGARRAARRGSRPAPARAGRGAGERRRRRSKGAARQSRGACPSGAGQSGAERLRGATGKRSRAAWVVTTRDPSADGALASPAARTRALGRQRVVANRQPELVGQVFRAVHHRRGSDEKRRATHQKIREMAVAKDVGVPEVMALIHQHHPFVQRGAGRGSPARDWPRPFPRRARPRRRATWPRARRARCTRPAPAATATPPPVR